MHAGGFFQEDDDFFNLILRGGAIHQVIECIPANSQPILVTIRPTIKAAAAGRAEETPSGCPKCPEPPPEMKLHQNGHAGHWHTSMLERTAQRRPACSGTAIPWNQSNQSHPQRNGFDLGMTSGSLSLPTAPHSIPTPTVNNSAPTPATLRSHSGGAHSGGRHQPPLWLCLLATSTTKSAIRSDKE